MALKKEDLVKLGVQGQPAGVQGQPAWVQGQPAWVQGQHAGGQGQPAWGPRSTCPNNFPPTKIMIWKFGQRLANSWLLAHGEASYTGWFQ